MTLESYQRAHDLESKKMGIYKTKKHGHGVQYSTDLAPALLISDEHRMSTLETWSDLVIAQFKHNIAADAYERRIAPHISKVVAKVPDMNTLANFDAPEFGQLLKASGILRISDSKIAQIFHDLHIESVHREFQKLVPTVNLNKEITVYQQPSVDTDPDPDPNPNPANASPFGGGGGAGLLSILDFVETNDNSTANDNEANESEMEMEMEMAGGSMMEWAETMRVERTVETEIEWAEIKRVEIFENLYHPQGMALIDDEFYIITSVEILEKPDRVNFTTAGKGIGHVIAVSAVDGLIFQQRALNLTFNDKRYHPGGVDYDGKHVWYPIAEYKPHSTAEIRRLDPHTLESEVMFSVDDHIGAVIYDRVSHVVYGMSWAGRTIYLWKRDGTLIRKWPNPSGLEAQDCQYAGMGMGISSGLMPDPNQRGGQIGGLELIALKDFTVVHVLPEEWFDMQLYSAGQIDPANLKLALTRNPVYIQKVVKQRGMRFHFLPEDGRNAHIFVYHATPVAVGSGGGGGAVTATADPEADADAYVDGDESDDESPEPEPMPMESAGTQNKVVLHSYNLTARYDIPENKTYITVGDSVSNKRWQKTFDESDYNASASSSLSSIMVDVQSEFDKMLPILNNGHMVCQYPRKAGESLRCSFKHRKTNDVLLSFEMKEI